MNYEQFKKLSEEIKSKISEQIKSKEFQEFVGKIKAARDDSGRFEVVVSTSDQDRQGDIVDQAGWDLTFYKMNPVVLWAHDYFSLPIGVCDSIEVKDGELVAKGKFAPEDANPFAQQIRKLYDLGIVKATSVGFIPLETDGQDIKRAELLEFSFVPVAANRYALSLRQVKEMALDMAMLKTKGLEIKANEPKEGDVCTMEDGTEGMMVMEGDEMVCKPKEKKEAKGAISDEVAAKEKRKKKWEKLDKVDNILYGFYNVYLDENTEPEAFDKLLAESIDMLKGLLSDPQAKASDQISKQSNKVGTFINLLTIKLNERARDILVVDKSGRVISQKNRDLITNSITQMKESIAALEELLKATEPQGDDQKIQRSKSAGFGEVSKALDVYLENRQVLRAAENAISASLEALNKKIRENSKK